MSNEKMAKVSLVLSVVAAVAAAVVSVFEIELYLAGTQWMLVAIIFAVWSVGLKR